MSTPPSRKTFPVDWTELHRDTRALAWRLAELGPFRGVVGIARGGLVPAAIIARELDIRMVETICVVTYRDDDTPGEPRILKRLEDDGAGLLVVDDLVDTGVTARLARAMLPQAHIATVYAKPAGRPDVDSFVTLVSQDTWIVFPWDDGDPVAVARRRAAAARREH